MVHFYWGCDKRVEQSMPPTSRYIKGLVLLIICQFHTLIHDRIQWKHYNLAILEILKLLSLLNFEWDLKFYFLHMKYNEVGTTLKHCETINGNVSDILLYLSLMVIVSGCLRVVPTSLDFIWRKQNFRSHSKFSRLNSFQDFKIGRIAMFPLDSIM